MILDFNFKLNFKLKLKLAGTGGCLCALVLFCSPRPPPPLRPHSPCLQNLWPGPGDRHKWILLVTRMPLAA